MRISYHRIYLVLLVVVLAVAAPLAAYAQAGKGSMDFDLPAQPLVRSLLAVGREAGVNITFDPKDVQGHRAAALRGSYNAREAVDRLLDGTGLVVQTTRKGSFVIVPGGGAAGTPSTAPAPAPASTYVFHLPAQSLVATLRAIRDQTGRGVALGAKARAIAGESTAAPIEGSMTPLQAVEKALADTGLHVYEWNGVLEVRNEPYGKNGVRILPTVTSTATVSGLSATRTATPLVEIPQSVSIIGQRRIRTENLVDLNDVMNQATGITVVQGSNSLNSLFYSRGFIIDSYHVDGGAAMGNNFERGMPPEMAEYSHVEILRGADALFAGAGQPGGTINLVRKRPRAKPALTFDQRLGSWQTFRTVLDATGPMGLNGKLRGRAVLMYDNRHFFYDTAITRRKKLYGVVEYDPTPATSLTFGGSVDLRNDVPMTSGLPRYVDGGDIHLRRSTFFGASWNREHARHSEIFVELKHAFNKRWNLKIQATRTHGYSNEFVANLDGPILRTGDFSRPPSANGLALTDTTLIGNIQLSGSFNIKGWSQRVLIGSDYQDNRYSDVSSGYSLGITSPISVFNLESTMESYPMPTTVTNVSTSPLSLRQWGSYIAFRLHPFVDGLSLVLGARDSFYKRSSSTTLAFGSSIFHIPGSSVHIYGKSTPFVGATYDLDSHYSIYASYSDIYSPAAQGTLRRADGSLLDQPEDGVNLETGIKGAWYGGSLNASLALFRIRQSGVAVQDGFDPSIPGCCYVEGANRSHGFEFNLNGRLARGWYASIGYTFNINHQAALPGENDGPPLQTQSPRNLLKLWTNYRLPGAWARWSVGGSLHAQTSSYKDGVVCIGDVDNVGRCLGQLKDFHVTQGFYTVVGLRLGYRINPEWQIAINVNNVLDRVYYQTMGNPITGSWYGAPRNFMVMLRGAF